MRALLILATVLLAGCGHDGLIASNDSVKTLCIGKAECGRMLTPEKKKPAPVKPSDDTPKVMKAEDDNPAVTPEEARQAQEHIDEVIKILERKKS